MKFIYGAVVGFTSVLLFLRGSHVLGLEGPSWLGWAAMAFVGVVVSVAIHEAGHVFAGWRMRFSFFSVSVGPLVLRRIRDRVRLRFELRGPVLMGGLTIMFPKSGEPCRASYAWYIAGGPLASGGFFLVLAASAFLLGSAAGLAEGALYFLWLTAVLSLAVGLLSLMPEDAGGIDSDGSYLRKLWKGDADAFIPQGLQQLIQLSIHGTRPRDLPPSLLGQLDSVKDSDKRAVGCLFLYTHHLDKGERKAAIGFLDEALDHVMKGASPLLGPSVFLEKAFVEAFFSDNPDSAAAFLEKGRKGYSEKLTLKRAEAAVFLAQGDVVRARKAAEQGLAEVPAHFDEGGVLLDQDLLHEILKTEKTV